MPRKIVAGLSLMVGLTLGGVLVEPVLAQKDCAIEELKNDNAVDGGDGYACPCFVPDEVVMSILTVPEDSDGNELLRAQILWDSFFGGPEVTVEKALIIYDLNQEGPVDPDSFSVIASFEDPELHKGFLNVFDLTPYGIILPERRFGIGIKFANDKTKNGGLDQPTIIEDLDGHNNWDGTVRNWVYAIPGGWKMAQALGTSGDWVIRAEVESCTFGPKFRMADPEPGIAGVVNTLHVTGAEAGARVYFVYGLRLGETPLPGCNGVVLGVKKQVLIDSLIANQEGEVDLNIKIPNAAQGVTVGLQAAQLKPTCTVTELVVHTFQ